MSDESEISGHSSEHELISDQNFLDDLEKNLCRKITCNTFSIFLDKKTEIEKDKSLLGDVMEQVDNLSCNTHKTNRRKSVAGILKSGINLLYKASIHENSQMENITDSNRISLNRKTLRSSTLTLNRDTNRNSVSSQLKVNVPIFGLSGIDMLNNSHKDINIADPAVVVEEKTGKNNAEVVQPKKSKKRRKIKVKKSKAKICTDIMKETEDLP